MAVTRRQFVRAGTAAAVTAGVSLSTVFAADVPPTAVSTTPIPTGRPRDPRGAPDMSAFRAQLATVFVLRGSTGARSAMVSMTLVEVEDLATPREKATAACGQERFSLMFQAPCDCPLTQGHHQVHHAALGSFPMFVVPMRSRDPRRATYEATFNRIVPC